MKTAAKPTVTMPREGGVIANIVTILDKAKAAAKPVTQDQIVSKLHRKFPDRDTNGMRTTVRAQLSRLPKERKYKIAKVATEKGVAYAAA